MECSKVQKDQNIPRQEVNSHLPKYTIISMQVHANLVLKQKIPSMQVLDPIVFLV